MSFKGMTFIGHCADEGWDREEAKIPTETSVKY